MSDDSTFEQRKTYHASFIGGTRKLLQLLKVLFTTTISIATLASFVGTLVVSAAGGIRVCANTHIDSSTVIVSEIRKIFLYPINNDQDVRT